MAQVLPNLQQQMAERDARIAALEAELAAAKAAKSGKISYKVSRKGAVSIYGLGRFPVTLYVSQFERLRSEMDAIAAWIATNPKTVWEADKERNEPACVATLSRD